MLENDLFTGVLFPDYYSTISDESIASSRETKTAKKDTLLNLHLYNSFKTEGKTEMPLVSPFNGGLPSNFISFRDRNKGLYAYGIHCYEYDYFIEQTWSNPTSVINCLKKYSCVIAPDFSVFVDLPRSVNEINLYKNRWVACYWQSLGINVIPSASWGNVDSLEYCFDGLPSNSIISVGHIVKGKDVSYKKLYRLGIESLISKKQPTKLIVYGSPLDFEPNVDIIYYKGNLEKLHNNEKLR